MEAEQRGGLTERLVGLMLTFEQPGEDPDVAGAVRMIGLEHERPDVGAVGLAVTVDATVSLLDGDERPRKIEMNQMVTFAVKVHTLRCHVAGEQDPHRRVGQTELLDHVHLLHIRHATVKREHLLR